MRLSKQTNRTDITAIEEPHLSSIDPEERIFARRIRIQKRNAAIKKRLQVEEDGKQQRSDKEETVIEKQVEKSTVELLTLIHEGKELISNVRVAADGQEVGRRVEQAAAKESRLKRLEEEARIARQKFEQINSKWESISVLNDPLDLHRDTEMQREKCVYLLEQKDQLIEELKAELKAGDIRFVKDQQRQAEDVSLLVERIDSQIAVMRRAYRRELLLIQQAIDIERKETMEVNNKRWEALYRQREEDEVNNLEQRTEALAEHNQLMQSIMVHHQEKFRATKISLEKDIQILQQQLEQVKAICLLNKEKMEYNYQVLKKRDEESLLIRSQQKRRINKLQDIVTTLKRKIVAMEKSTQGEIKRLTSEVIKLHRNIKEIQLKADHFCSVNERKYFQLWKFNHDSAQKLLDKILSIDRLVHEQHLGLTWQAPTAVAIGKEDLPSYKYALDKSSTDVAVVNQVHNLGLKASDESAVERLRGILQAVADRSGFLVEERLNILLAPYTRSQNTLVRIDNVFHVLGIANEEEMEVLRHYMEPYLVCSTCQPIMESACPVSPPASPPLPSPTKEEVKYQVTEKLKQIVDEGERIAREKEKISMEDIYSEGQKFSFMSMEEVQETGGSIGPWLAPSNVDLSPHPLNVTGKSVVLVPSLTNMMTITVRKPVHPPLEPHQELADLVPSSKADVLSTETEKGEAVCQDASHRQVIHPVFVLQALREFVQELHANKKGLCQDEKIEDKKAISRQLSDSDVKYFWEQFRAAFPVEKEKLWDCLHLGLQKYHCVLQERHKLNIEIEQLKLQNTELRRLLQKHTLPNNMKSTTRVPRQNLPPLAGKTSSLSLSAPTPAPTPARLILTFNNSSRL